MRHRIKKSSRARTSTESADAVTGSSKDKTLHQIILGEIEQRIVSGEWQPGFRLPFEVDLAAQYGCSRMTVNKVMTQLAKAGLIERHRKAGSFVATPKAQSAALELHDIRTEVASLGVLYSYALLSREERHANEEDRRLLELKSVTPMIALLALHSAGGRPFCVEERRINAGAVPEAASTDFTVLAPGEWLIAQVPWSAAENRIQALPASSQIARLLQRPTGTPCLVVERRTWNNAGPITFVRLLYPWDSHALIARFAPSS